MNKKILLLSMIFVNHLVAAQNKDLVGNGNVATQTETKLSATTRTEKSESQFLTKKEMRNEIANIALVTAVLSCVGFIPNVHPEIAKTAAIGQCASLATLTSIGVIELWEVLRDKLTFEPHDD